MIATDSGKDKVTDFVQWEDAVREFLDALTGLDIRVSPHEWVARKNGAEAVHKAMESANLEFTGTDNFPLWVGDRIYFVSDRDNNRRLNLWAYETASGDMRQVTFHEDYDVLWPSRGDGGIVYENGGWVYHFDPVSEERNQSIDPRTALRSVRSRCGRELAGSSLCSISVSGRFH